MNKKIHHSFIYLIVIGLTGEFVSSQDNSDEERFCEAAVQCPDYEATQYRMMASFLPICYCDNLCTAYNDCCKLKASYPKSEQLQELQRLRYNGDPKSFSTCLGLDGENIGFWAVNRCGSEGPICTMNMSFANVLSHLPVTDNDNVTYFGEDCAKCNNVTSFSFSLGTAVTRKWN
ncbi:hypothetical protein FSP39_008585 [Pinctada imbricata]|uniref:SMB domain-containing protein n=1 Tax=Pinctada imbricata TaxID=66713 RepID=A0AA89C8T9_PINIB|nr:hypothetical protein FSP39_008585 [Pinctada imbricata]